MCSGLVTLFHCLNLFQPSAAFHIETSHLICTTNQDDWFLYEAQHLAETGKLLALNILTILIRCFNFLL